MARKAKRSTQGVAKPADNRNVLEIDSKPSPITAPIFNSTGAQLMVAGNDATILFLRHRPTSTSAQGKAEVTLETVACAQMSMQSLKDLSVMINQVVRDLEAEWGEIETAYTRKMAPRH